MTHKIRHGIEFPEFLTIPETTLSIIEFQSFLREVFEYNNWNVSVLIGVPYVRPYEGGPPYISIMNGKINPEGGSGNFCGTDIEVKEAVISHLKYISRLVEKEKATKLYLRTGLDISTEKARFDGFDSESMECKYYPASLRVYSRVAFE